MSAAARTRNITPLLAPADDIYIEDSFTDADTTNVLTAHASEEGDWQTAGSWTAPLIQNNRAHGQGSFFAVSGAINNSQPPSGDYEVEFVARLLSAGTGMLVLRADTPSMTNGYQMGWQDGVGFVLQKRASGSGGALDSGTVTPYNDTTFGAGGVDRTIVFRVEGTTLTYWVDGVQRGTGTDNDFAGPRMVGFFIQAPAGAQSSTQGLHISSIQVRKIPTGVANTHSGTTAQEQDDALAGTVIQPRVQLGGTAAENDDALAGVSIQPQVVLGGTAQEQDDALPGVAHSPNAYAGGRALENDDALAGTVIQPQVVLGGRALENDDAIAGTTLYPHVKLGGSASEQDDALPGVALQPWIKLGTVASTQEDALPGLAIVPNVYAGGRALENDDALAGSVVQPQVYAGGRALENDDALAGTAFQGSTDNVYPGQRAIENDQARPGVAIVPTVYFGGRAVENDDAVGGIVIQPQVYTGAAAIEQDDALAGSVLYVGSDPSPDLSGPLELLLRSFDGIVTLDPGGGPTALALRDPGADAALLDPGGSATLLEPGETSATIEGVDHVLDIRDPGLDLELED